MRLKKLINVAENKKKMIKEKGVSNIDDLLDNFQKDHSFFDDFDPIEQMEIWSKIFPDIKK